MEKYTLDKDISVFYVKAASFPFGIGDAYQQLRSLLPEGSKKTLYGISNPSGNAGIVYRAAAEEAFPGEGDQKGCDTFLIKKGLYISEFLTDWKKDESIVNKTFQKLLAYPGIDMKGYCLEIYDNDKDVRCLVPLT